MKTATRHAHPQYEDDPDWIIRSGLRNPANWSQAVLLFGIGAILLVASLLIGSPS